MKALIVSLLSTLIFCSCTSTPKALVEEIDFDWNRSLSAALIPFSADFEEGDFTEEEQKVICAHMSQEFYRSFAPLDFEDLEPRLVNQYLLREKLNAEKLLGNKEFIRKLGHDLNSDLVIAAKVKDYSYLSLLLHERWYTAMELSIYDAQNGRLIWKFSHEQSRQELHAPTSPGALASEVLGVLMRDKQMDLLVGRLCREIAASIPKPMR